MGQSERQRITDSLEQRFTELTDSAKVRMAHRLFQRYFNRDNEKANQYAQHTLDGALQLNWPDQIAQGYNDLGIARLVQGDMQGGIALLLKVTEMKTPGDSMHLAYAYKALGNAFQMQNDMAQAVQLFLKSLNVYRKVGTPANVNAALNSIGLGYRELGDEENAIKFFEERIAHSRQHDFQSALASSLNNLAGIYKDRKQWDRADQLYTECLHIREERDDARGKALVLGNIGELNYRRGRTELGLDQLMESVRIRAVIGDKRGQATNLQRSAAFYIELGQHRRAATLGNTGYDLALEVGNAELVENGLGILRDAYSGMGDYRNAFKFQSLHAEMRDSLFNQEKTKQIVEMKAKFDLDLKEQEIAQQENEIALLGKKNKAETRLRWILIACAGLLLLSAAILWNRYQLKQRANTLLETKNSEIEEKNEEIKVINKELEKKMLRAQMDPHFIFNSFNSIQHFITVNDKESALKYLTKFSKLVRHVLDSSINDKVTLAEELQLLESYIQLEELRLNHSFSFAINVDNNVDLHNIEVPFLILQPYVENAIKHGLKSKDGHGQLDVDINMEGEILVCSITDDGIGRERARALRPDLPRHKSHGMSVTQRRLELLNKTSEIITTVDVADLVDPEGEPAGTRVDVRIPV